MHSGQLAGARGIMSRVRMKLFHVAALALLAALAFPARAGNDRAVKLRVAPVYPEIARRLKISGEVKIEAIVDAQGKVKSVKTVSGNRFLGAAAEDAVRQWKFEPGGNDDVVIIPVNFTMDQ